MECTNAISSPAFRPSTPRNLIRRVLAMCHVKLTQSTALERKRFDRPSLSSALRNLWLLLVLRGLFLFYLRDNSVWWGQCLELRSRSFIPFDQCTFYEVQTVIIHWSIRRYQHRIRAWGQELPRMLIKLGCVSKKKATENINTVYLIGD